MKWQTRERIREVQDWFLTPFRWIRRQYWRIERTIRWLPRVYMTPDFDFGYALMFFQWKLQDVRKVIDENRRHVGDEHRVRRMWELDKILQRIIDEDYLLQIYKDDVGCGPIKLSEPDENGLCEVLDLNMPPLKACVTKDMEENYYKYAEELYNQDVDFLASYLKKYSRGWWD